MRGAVTGADVDVTFWGVRGGMPAPGASTARFGGNSPCVEVKLDAHRIVFDAGTGLRALGRELIARSPVSGDLLFSHTNFNRICGLPFFAAAFHPQNSFRFWCGHRPEEGSIKEVLTRLMTDPVFPVPIDIFNAALSFHDFPGGEPIALGDGIATSTMAIDSVRPGTAYRIGHRGASLVHACAVSAEDAAGHLAGFASDADLLVASLLDVAHVEGDRLLAGIAARAGVARLVVTDHAPEEDDAALEAREAVLLRQFDGASLAREGATLHIEPRA